MLPSRVNDFPVDDETSGDDDIESTPGCAWCDLGVPNGASAAGFRCDGFSGSSGGRDEAPTGVVSRPGFDGFSGGAGAPPGRSGGATFGRSTREHAGESLDSIRSLSDGAQLTGRIVESPDGFDGRFCRNAALAFAGLV
jgi:hypothetical protein